MPELPEVEALRLGLVRNIAGSKILKVEVRQEKIIAGKGTLRSASKKNTLKFIENLKNKKIVSIDRRAKNLIFNLSDGIILAHLKMTGQFVFVPKGKHEKISFGGHPIEETESLGLPHKHTHIIFTLDNGTLYYNDVRQFGYVLYLEDKNILEKEKHFEGVGMEPFSKDFTLEYFKHAVDRLKKRSLQPIKKILLDQKIVVGVGNIYCDEVLWASSVLPTRKLKSLKENEIELIYKNIKKILEKAIKSGGSSVANYLLADGKRGNYADYHNAYQKTGTKCKFPNCSGTIKKTVLAGRGTHFCPKHQK